MILAHVILAGAFVWIYSRGVEAKPWLAQGFRFGLAIALPTRVRTDAAPKPRRLQAGFRPKVVEERGIPAWQSPTRGEHA